MSKHHRKGEVFFAEIVAMVPGKKLVAKATNENLFSAIREIKDEVEQEIKKYKFKKTDIARRQQRKAKKVL